MATSHTKILFYYKNRFPFNWRAPLPYLWVSIIQAVQVVYTGGICVLSFMLFFGVCLFLVTFVKDFENNLNDVCEAIENAAETKELTSKSLRLKFKRLFHDLIRFHADVKQLCFGNTQNCDFLDSFQIILLFCSLSYLVWYNCVPQPIELW